MNLRSQVRDTAQNAIRESLIVAAVFTIVFAIVYAWERWTG